MSGSVDIVELETFQSISEILSDIVLLTILNAARFTVILHHLPPFKMLRIPTLTLTSLAILLSLLMFPMDILDEPQRMSVIRSNYILLIAKEYALGFFMAVILGMPFWLAEAAGSIVDVQRGGGFSETNSPLSGSETTVVGIFFWLIVTVIYFTNGGALLLIDIVYNSLATWPPTQLTVNIDFFSLEALMEIIIPIVVGPVLIALPFIVTMLFADIALLYVSTFVPQLNIMQISMPIKSAMMVFLLIFYIAEIPQIINKQTGEMVEFLGEYLIGP